MGLIGIEPMSPAYEAGATTTQLQALKLQKVFRPQNSFSLVVLGWFDAQAYHGSAFLSKHL